MKTAAEIVKAVGIPTIMRIFNVKRDAAYKAMASGRLPSSWYVALCRHTGEQLPYSAFSFKSLDEGERTPDALSGL
jgi:hypothetical protein